MNNKSKIILFFTALLLISAAVLLVKSKTDSSATLVGSYVKVCDKDDVSCHEVNLPYQNPALSIDARVDDLLQRMTIAEKIGQMALIEKNSIKDPNDIARYGLGALMSGGGAQPKNNTPKDWLAMVEDLKEYGQKTRLAIPVLYGADAIHGHSNVIGATIFPHAIGLAASNDANLVKAVARATAEEVAATGITWVFSPNLDVAQDMRWGRAYETFGSDTARVGTLGHAYVEGLQSANQNGLIIAATAKHYIGNGATEWGSSINKDFFIDQGNSNMSETELRKTHLAPFKQAIDAGVKTVMVGLSKWNGSKVVFNKYLVTDVLKNELGFKGFVVSDWYGVYEKEQDRYGALVSAVNAGIDMIMLPYDYQNFSESMHRALASGDISPARVDDAVRRILRVKFEIGLFDAPATDSSGLENVGSPAHRELARQAVRKSLVVLKDGTVLPVSKNTQKILVAGSAADNLGKQMGGWTVEWQGIDGNWIPGTTILKGIREAVSSGTSVEYDLAGNFNQQSMADIGIAVVGEKPYAEGWGDNPDPSLSSQDLEAINNLKKFSKKVIVVIVSGRPLNITQYAKVWDAIIAVWLPGSEGQGVADVLFGDYPAIGTLPVAWEL
jgi:beta-glucosidase